MNTVGRSKRLVLFIVAGFGFEIFFAESDGIEFLEFVGIESFLFLLFIEDGMLVFVEGVLVDVILEDLWLLLLLL